MKKNIKMTIKILVLVLIGGWVLSKISFETDIKQTVTAEKYENGVSVEETSVFINGARSNYLFADEQMYNGQFYIESYERTGRERMKANITWNEKKESERILYYQNGTFPSLAIKHQLLINKKMDEFTIGFEDGTVIATSDEMYRNYINKIMLHCKMKLN